MLPAELNAEDHQDRPFFMATEPCVILLDGVPPERG